MSEITVVGTRHQIVINEVNVSDSLIQGHNYELKSVDIRLHLSFFVILFLVIDEGR